MLNFGKPLSPPQRLEKAVIDIMSHDRYVALAGTLMIGDRRIDDTIPTACTNGRDEFYSSAFIEEQNDAQLRYLVLHEVGHKLYKHLTTWRWMFEEDQELANIACDYVLNIRLDDENTDGFAKMPEGGMIDTKYRAWDSAAVFHDLKKRHGSKSERAKGDGKGDDGRSLEPMPGGDGEGFDKHDWQGAKDMTVEEQKALAQDLDEAIRQGALMAGKTGSGGDRAFDELLAPKVDWREVLREFVTETCAGSDYSTWQRPSRRFIGAGYYMPSGISEKIGEIVVAPDMSGSTFTPRMMRAIMSEVKGIAESINAEAVRLLYWDTKICADERYEQHELDGLITTTKPEGGGGTVVECVPEHITKEGISPQAVIVLTDGYLGGDWGQSWACPVLWVVVDNKSANASVGKTLHVQSGEI